MTTAMTETAKIRLADFSFRYGKTEILHRLNAEFPEHRVTAIIGPSGSGKSTLLSVFNRLWAEIPEARVEGLAQLCLAGSWQDLCDRRAPSQQLRRKVGMVFQSPNPLPMSIFRNVAFPLKLAGVRDREEITGRVESALRRTLLWEEVKERLATDARSLSGGQQQRLCIARSLILEPEVLLLDEPTSALDWTAAAGIEELLIGLKKDCTLVLVSHYLEQVERLADGVFEMSGGILRRLDSTYSR
ncbi:MAG: ATP-binding cassette domain-containing protein [Desulfuromonadaceae bacterium]|nr:ATP-binding cassette domain-containing protein [Desulfuromonadaceae bacterium]